MQGLVPSTSCALAGRTVKKEERVLAVIREFQGASFGLRAGFPEIAVLGLRGEIR